MRVAELLDRAKELGATFTLPGPGRLHVAAADPLPIDLVQELTDNKPKIIEYLSEHSGLMELPWPIGYGGLLADEVSKAENYNDRQSCTDPVDRKLNVLSWMWCYYREKGDVDMALRMKKEYHQLRHADPSIQEICGICEYRTKDGQYGENF